MEANLFSATALKVKEEPSVPVTGAWINVINGHCQIMLEVGGKWLEVLSDTNLMGSDKSIELSANEISHAQPLGWLYKEGG